MASPALLPRPHGAHEPLDTRDAHQNLDEALVPGSLLLPRLWLQAFSARGPSCAWVLSLVSLCPGGNRAPPPPGTPGPDLWPSAPPPGVACSAILMYTFCTDCWLIAVLYFTWLAFDWNTPKKGESTASQPHPLALGMLPPAHRERPQRECHPFFLSTY